MSKERVEEIKSRYIDYETDFNIHSEDVEWLIEQAERVKELEQKNDRLKQEADFWRVEDREMMRLSHENKRYRETLAFYANKYNHMQATNYFMDSGLDPSAVMKDEGELAREALEADEG